MYYFLSLLTGMLISVIIVLNGQLKARAGQALALVIVHLAGLIFMSVYCLIKKERPKFKKLPLYLYSGGFLSVLTILFNNLAFGRMSVSAMMALSLLGDSATGLAADHFGLFGTQKQPFIGQKLWGYLLLIVGIVLMLDGFAHLPVLVSLAAGVLVMLTRLFNGELARQTSLEGSSFINYLTALPLALLALLFWRGEMKPLSYVLSGPFYIYLGGIIGAVIVLLSSLCIAKIPSFYMALVLFLGKILAGLGLDMWLEGRFLKNNLLGGLFVLGGLLLNLHMDRKRKRPARGT